VPGPHSSDTTPRTPAPQTPAIGARIARLRKAQGLTLARLASRIGVSEATMSRIENGLANVSAHHLFALARELGADMADFFRDDAVAIRPGLRSLCRAGEGVRARTARYESEILCADIARKQLHPAINTVTARTLEEVGGLQRHDGEEFVHVLGGVLVLHSELYAPARLETGDSLYFDARMAHAYLCGGPEPARILVVVGPVEGPIPMTEGGGA
jgi:transcriptional regulator with XRE-family HTH domain